MIKNSKIVLALIVSVSCMYSNTQIKSVDIYKNRTVLNQELDLKNTSVDLLGKVSLETIKFNIDKSCKILDLDFKVIDTQKTQIDKLISNMEEKISKALNKKKALEANIKFLQGLKLQENQNIETLEKSSEFLIAEITKSYDEIYGIENDVKEYQKELNQLKNQTFGSVFTKLDYKIDCKNSDKIIVSYPTNLISVSKFNTINYDTTNKNIELKSSAYVTQNTGVNFEDVVMNFYVGNYFNLVKPFTFIPEYLDVTPNRPVAFASDMVMEKQTLMRSNVAKKSIVNEYVELTTKSVNRVSHVDLKTGKKTKVDLSNDSIKASNYIEIDGYSTSNPFYKVDFKSDKLYERSFVQLYIDGVLVGRNSIDEIKKDKKSSIYFGVNSFIDVKKELIKDMKEEPFFSINVLKTQKLWKYEIKNSGKEEEKISLVERVPVSKHEDIKVKVIGESKYTKLDKNGKIYFDFVLKPKETKIIEFGYEIEKPVKSK